MQHTTRRLLIALAVLLGSAALLVVTPGATARAAPAARPAAAPAAAPAAQPNCGYPAASCACPTLSVGSTAPRAGESVAVTGSNFRSGRNTTLFLKPVGSSDPAVALRSLRTTSAGSFATTVTIPMQANGRFDVLAVKGTPSRATVAAGIVCAADPAAQVDVTARAKHSPARSDEPATAFTGVNLLWLLLIAGALLVLGTYATRRGRPRKIVRTTGG